MCSVCQKSFDSEGKETLPCFHEICKSCFRDAKEIKRNFCEICHYPYNNVISISSFKPRDDEYFKLLQTFFTKTYPRLLEKIKKISQLPDYEKHLENVNNSDFKDVYKFRLIEVYKILIEHDNNLKLTLENMKRVEELVCSVVTNPDENQKQMLPIIDDYIHWVLSGSEHLIVTYFAKVLTPKSENYRPEDGDTFNKVSIIVNDIIRKINISEVTFINNEYRIIRNLCFGVTDENVFFTDEEVLYTIYPSFNLDYNDDLNKFYIKDGRLSELRR